MKPEMRIEKICMRAAELGEQSCVPDLLGELILQNHLEFRLDEDDEIFEGYGRCPNGYPYRQYNAYTRELKEKEVQTVVLENRHLKAVFLPEYGGRLWELWDKESGRNLLYTNDVLQFSNLAVRNAWFSGGVEWNIGIIGHNPFTTDRLYTAQLEDEEGNPILRMYEYERIRKVTYQMDFWLGEEDRFLNCRMRIVNESEKVIPMYWWSNIAVPEYEDGRIVVPAKQAFTYADGAVFKVDIPMVKGIDITDYKKIRTSVDYFFDIPQDSPKYIANVDATGRGLLQISTKRLRSRKLFSWGNREPSDHWQEFLTDKAGRYVEIQAGLGKTQYGCVPMAPHTAWEWMEQYGAVHIPDNILNRGQEERAEFLTEEIRKNQMWEKMESVLKRTKSMAKTKAEIIMAGSGYGALREQSERTGHLKFQAEAKSLRDWRRFFESGRLHCPQPTEAPDEFLLDAENVDFLEQHIGENKDNWYAHYQLGIGLYVRGEYEKAKEALEKSFAIEENPWSAHALACTCFVSGEREEAADNILQGIQMKAGDISYLKEGFKLLFLCEEHERLCTAYEKLGQTEQSINKIKFYYICSLHKIGNNSKAFELLEENGGLEIEDIREGEDSVAQLWIELCQSIYGEKREVPYRYNFKAY